MGSKNKKVLTETRVRWARLGGIINSDEERRRLNEAKTSFPGDEIELQEMDMDTRDQNNRLYEYGDEMDDEYGDEMDDGMGMDDDFGGGDQELADLEGDDMDVEMGDDMGMGVGDEETAAQLISAVSDAISKVLGVQTDVETGVDDMGMDVEDDLDMGGEVDTDMGMEDDFGGEDDLDDLNDDELMEELENSINPSGGKVDNSHKDHSFKKEKSHLKNSINERYANQLAESVVRKLAKHLRKRK